MFSQLSSKNHPFGKYSKGLRYVNIALNGHLRCVIFYSRMSSQLVVPPQGIHYPQRVLCLKAAYILAQWNRNYTESGDLH